MAVCRSSFGTIIAGNARRLRPSRAPLPRTTSIDHSIEHRLAYSDRPLRGLRLYASQASRPVITPSEHHGPVELALSDAQRQTIYALSTPPGKGGIAVVRVSGPDALRIWDHMVKPQRGKGRQDHMDSEGNLRESSPEAWKMYRCQVVHPNSGDVLDDGLAVFFKGPRSFTTEDVAELHVHSGRAIISSVLNAISFLPFCRPAEPGEFTRRAYEGGRLDLTQVEGLRDLIDAETEGQRKLALRTAGGTTRTRLEQLRNDIIKSLSLVEAIVDFGEGENIEEGLLDQARQRVQDLRDSIHKHLSDNRRGEIMRSGIRLAIFGPPNAGKSSLLNFLAQREAAIVTPIPGTTRDILELSLDIGGLPVIVADTAGLRNTKDVVELIGVERARKLIQSADVSLCVLSLPEVLKQATDGSHVLEVPPDIAPFINENTFILLNKIDLASPLSLPLSPVLPWRGAWSVSLSTGYGSQVFIEGLAKALQERYNLLEENDTRVEEPLITHSRHRAHLETALSFLDAFLATSSDDVVLAAEELRYAAQAIGKVSGIIEVEHILDAVFRDFCIGK